jgi:hypothetical protein
MILLSNTSSQVKQPGTQNSSAGFPQQLSLFLTGGYASHFGGLAQITYTHSDDKFSMDNTDLRYANQGKLGDKDLNDGITVKFRFSGTLSAFPSSIPSSRRSF